jgi:X-linked retinitis pigmentosa GTPase regulator
VYNSLDNGELYTFGSSDYGQLGTGKSEKEVFPFKIDLKNRCNSVACGVKHTLILTEFGKVYGAGGNASGELGTGNKRSTNLFTKVQFVNEVTIKKVAATYFSAAVSESGELYVWGTGSFGEFIQP